MSLLREILSHEVFPATGCTEPIACALAAATAAHHLDAPVERLRLRVDRGTFKNGAAVVVPHSEGEHGNAVAGALGAAIAAPDARMELLSRATPRDRAQARALRSEGRVDYDCATDRTELWIEAEVEGGGHACRCLISGGHTRVTCLERDGESLLEASAPDSTDPTPEYRRKLRDLDLEALLRLTQDLSPDERAEIRRGVEMNLSMAERGRGLGGTAHSLHQMERAQLLAEDVFFRAKTLVAAAVDARMAGLAHPVMTSGGSGNQGVVATLAPWEVGRSTGVEEDRIIESIAVAHVINAWIKSFVGELAVICGCAMAAGIAAAAAIVYQRLGPDRQRITSAINNVIGDLGGLICDGAKPGCALKTITSVDAALRSAFMAVEGYGVNDSEGVVGRTAEESIRNLSRISLEGMLGVDPTVLDILRIKSDPSGRA